MAFTAAQKKDIRKYLGVPFGFYDLTTRLESMMDLVGAEATDSAEIIGWLTELTNIDASLVASASGASYSYGALKKVDEVEFHPTDGDSSSKVGSVDRGRMLIQRLARALGVSDVLPLGDYFAAGRAMSGPMNFY